MADCRKSGIKVLSPDVNESAATFSVNRDGDIRFGLGGMKGFGDNVVSAIIGERDKNGLFADLFDFMERMAGSINRKALETLIYSGALDSFGYKRSQYFQPGADGDLFIDELVRYSGMYAADKLDAASSLFGDTEELRPQRPQVPPFTGEENSLNLLQEEKQYVGMYISAHPLDQHRFEIENFANCQLTNLQPLIDEPNCQLTNLQPLIDELEQAHKTAKASIAGIVADVKTMNSKNGTPGAKVVLEDFSGNYEFVLFGSDYQRYMPFLQLHNQIFIDGEIGERYFLKPEERASGKKAPYGFKIKNISLLGTLCETRLGGLDLQLDTRLIDADFRKKLLKLLQSNKGKLPLNIHLIDVETGYKLDFFSKKFKVDVSQEFLNRLSDLGFKYNLLRKN